MNPSFDVRITTYLPGKFVYAIILLDVLSVYCTHSGSHILSGITSL